MAKRGRKSAISQMMYEKPLPFPTKTMKTGNGQKVEVYVIPDDQKESVLNQLWLSGDIVPALNEERLDLHVEKRFQIRDFLVVREDDMNYLVSPYYLEGGGTVIDWMDCEQQSDDEK